RRAFIDSVADPVSPGDGRSTRASRSRGVGLAPTGAPPVELIRGYRLLEKVGEGGMGVVYRAVHSRLKRIVALKILPDKRNWDPQAVARFEQEMEAVGRVDHPNIVRASDAGESGGRHYLVMEYVDGCDLSELVGRIGRLSVPDACEVVRQAAIGL